ncbi:MAG: hypothetical protein H5T75_08900 [Coriobacteriia bacterium]|nr:hypothetical protein [Coriobacteriia bacterium]
MRGVPSIESSVKNAWKSSSFYERVLKKGRSSAQYFDAVTRTPYQIGDILYSSWHVAIVISNGKDPEIAECTPWPDPNGWRDGTKTSRLSKRWSSWKPTNAGRYIVAYSHNVIP